MTMVDRYNEVDELLEAHLRSLADVEPPPGLADRIMAEVMSAAVDFDPVNEGPRLREDAAPFGSTMPKPSMSDTLPNRSLPNTSVPTTSVPRSSVPQGEGQVLRGKSRQTSSVGRWRRVPVGQAVAAAVVLAMSATLLIVRWAPIWISLLAGAGQAGVNLLHTVADIVLSVATIGLAWLHKLDVTLAACRTVMRVITNATVAETGLLITVVVVGCALGLQLVLFAVVARRPQAR